MATEKIRFMTTAEKLAESLRIEQEMRENLEVKTRTGDFQVSEIYFRGIDRKPQITGHPKKVNGEWSKHQKYIGFVDELEIIET